MNLSRRNLSIFAGVAIGIIFFALALWIIPRWQSDAYRAKFTPEDIQKLEQKDRIQLEKAASDVENSARLILAQIIGGLALLSGLYFTYLNVKTAQKNLRVTEEGKITERFSNAVELLGSEKLDVRLGGIYALERISRDSKDDHWTVMEVLTAFVRENSHKRLDQIAGEQTPPEKIPPREDIQAIITVIGRRKWTETEFGKQINLQKVNLAGYVLIKAKLSGANLSGANLIGANLSRADLSEADLSGADLSGANLSRANLSEANLSGADLRGANLSAANLFGADLREVRFLDLGQILSAEEFEYAKLPPELEKELKKWKAEQVKEKTESGEDSSENRAGE